MVGRLTAWLGAVGGRGVDEPSRSLRVARRSAGRGSRKQAVRNDSRPEVVGLGEFWHGTYDRRVDLHLVTGRHLTVALRAATTADVEAVAAIETRARRPLQPDAIGRAIGSPDRLVLVAEHLGQDGATTIVGWAQTYHHTTLVDAAPAGHYLGGLTVDPDWRRQGIATTLTDARMAWISQRAEQVYYVVNASNDASINLHRHWSFVEVARAPRLTGILFAGGVGLLMRASLGP